MAAILVTHNLYVWPSLKRHLSAVLQCMIVELQNRPLTAPMGVGPTPTAESVSEGTK